MDDLDLKIVQLFIRKMHRKPVKDALHRSVSLTSFAVSSRIHRLEQEVSSAATVGAAATPAPRHACEALISFWQYAATRASFPKR